MNKIFEESIYLEGFLDYYEKAKKLEEKFLNVMKHPDSAINDQLMLNVPIYNNVHRRYAGFSNGVEALWYGSKAPKGIYAQYDQCHKKWSLKTWLYVMLFHRVTGSGASFEKDHGFRNSLLPEFGKLNDIKEMAELTLQSDNIFTSLGNMIPLFTKFDGVSIKPGIHYLTKDMVTIVENLTIYLTTGHRKKIYEVADFLKNQNRLMAMKYNFNFQYSAFSMDVAEYYPNYVDPTSYIYGGVSAARTLSMVLPKIKKVSNFRYENEAMQHLCNLTGNYVNIMDIEDVCCDFIRYLKEYVSEEYKKYLTKEQMLNSSVLKKSLGVNKYYQVIKHHMNLWYPELQMLDSKLELKFKKGQKVSFVSFEKKLNLEGFIVKSYPWKNNINGEFFENVWIQVGEKIYRKRADTITLLTN